MEAETKVFLVTYGRSDSPNTAQYKALLYEIVDGDLILYDHGLVAAFRAGYWLGVEIAGSRIKVEEDGS